MKARLHPTPAMQKAIDAYAEAKIQGIQSRAQEAVMKERNDIATRATYLCLLACYPDPWAYNAMHYDAARRTLYIFDELTRRRTSNRDTAQLLLDRGLTREDKVCADSAEPKSIADYNKYGVKTFPARKGPKSVRYGTKWLQMLEAIVIDPERCPDTAKEFSEYEYERDGKTGEVLEGYPDLNNHHIDAVRYAMESTANKAGDTAETRYKSIFV